MSYQVVIQPKALKSLEKINNPAQSKLRIAILGLAENPRPFGYIKVTDINAYRVRVGNFRVIYEIADAVLQVHVIEIGDRKNVYD